MSISDVISLVGLQVSILAGFLALFLWKLDKSLAAQRADTKKILDLACKLRLANSLTANVLAELASYQSMHSSVISNALRSPLESSAIDGYARSFGYFEDCLERRLNELLLLNDDIVVRNSAINELGHEYGTTESLILMKDVLSDVYPDDEFIRNGIRILANRLDELASRAWNQ